MVLVIVQPEYNNVSQDLILGHVLGICMAPTYRNEFRIRFALDRILKKFTWPL